MNMAAMTPISEQNTAARTRFHRMDDCFEEIGCAVSSVRIVVLQVFGQSRKKQREASTKMFNAIVIMSIGMKSVRLDFYVIESLMRDLVGHDKKPSAFVVYLYLWSRLSLARSRRVQASHQTIASDTGLSKSAVQLAVRHLLRRRLLRSERASTTTTPEYSLLKPWRRRH